LRSPGWKPRYIRSRGECFVRQCGKTEVDKFVKNTPRMHQSHIAFQKISEGNTSGYLAVPTSESEGGKGRGGDEGTRRDGREGKRGGVELKSCSC